MAISRIGASTVQAASIAIPGSYAANDLIFIFGSRNSSSAITYPSGWIQIYSGTGGGGISIIAAFKFAQSASESAPTFTSASILHCAVYRSSNGIVFPGLDFSPDSNSSNGINYSQSNLLPYRPGVQENWYISAAAQLNTANAVETPLSGSTNINFNSITGLKSAIHDTNASQASNWSGGTVTLANTAYFRSVVCRICEMPGGTASGGLILSRPMNGGY
jgi:hypothetical protein